MTFDLSESFQLHIANLQLKDVYSAVFGTQETKIPFFVWLLENPESPLSLPGRICLRHHDYIHILLGRGISFQDEAFVIGFTMGNDSEIKKIHLWTYKFFAKFIYPHPYKFHELDLLIFDLGFQYGKKIKFKCINKINFELYQNESINYLRNLFGINLEEIKLIQQFESWLLTEFSNSDVFQVNKAPFHNLVQLLDIFGKN
ncbi:MULTISPECIES: hypothetical protein [unclassified Anabaena]|uniref:hypothetical protein n=1 Tax=unclassified Anabaena TaxID=2619674 RepID=UPI0039C6F336